MQGKKGQGLLGHQDDLFGFVNGVMLFRESHIADQRLFETLRAAREIFGRMSRL